jgi:hypothetical protein
VLWHYMNWPDPFLYQPVTHDRNQTWAKWWLASRVISLLGFLLPDWYISVLLDHISERVPGPTDTETYYVYVEVSGV